MRTCVQWVLRMVMGGAAAACGPYPEESCDNPGVDCDVTLEPPEVGHQIIVGPYPVPDGTEVLRCFWSKIPEDMDVTEIEVKYNLGSHHLDIFTVDYAMPDGDFDCSKPEEWGAWPSEIARGLDPESRMPTMLVGFQNDSVSWQLPAGVSYQLHAGQQLLIQSHFANVASQDTATARLYDVINFHASPDPTEHAAETLFDEDTDLFLPAHQESSVTRICEFPSEVNLIAMFGHFHSRGTLHEVFMYDPDTGETGDLIYQNRDWDDPPFYTMGDEWSEAMGCTAIKMVAHWNNFEDRDIVWGNFVEENEHFETYAFFYPYLGLNWPCVCRREGEPFPGTDEDGNCPKTL
jgi:hypothetical protein